MRLTFTDRTIGKLRAKATDGRAMYTTDARDSLEISEQVWTRLTRAPNFPPMMRIGRRWMINPGQLADFLEFWNRLETALRLAEVAKLCHTTPPRVRALLERGDFPPALGIVHGHPRWEQETIVTWLHERFGGLKLPEEDAPPVRRVASVR